MWLNKQRYEGNIGHIAFLVVFFAANGLAAYTHFVDNTGPGLLILVGFAKLFGNLLNLNCSFIALPVSRTVIRWYEILWWLNIADLTYVLKLTRSSLTRPM